MRRTLAHSHLGAVLLTAITIVTATSCGDDSQQSAQSAKPAGALTVEFGADGIVAPVDLPTGVVTFAIRTPAGADELQIQLFQLQDDADPSAFFAALANDDFPGVLQMSRPAGGINLAPGGSTELTVDLVPARYVFFDPDSGNVSEPMLAAGATDSAAEPVDGTVSMRDLEIALPAGFGNGTYALETTDDSVHGLTLIDLDEGVTLEQVQALIATDADLPGTEVVKAGNLGVGTRQILDLDLPAGHYIAASYFPDFESGTTQAAQGMVTEFTVDG